MYSRLASILAFASVAFAGYGLGPSPAPSAIPSAAPEGDTTWVVKTITELQYAVDCPAPTNSQKTFTSTIVSPCPSCPIQTITASNQPMTYACDPSDAATTYYVCPYNEYLLKEGPGYTKHVTLYCYDDDNLLNSYYQDLCFYPTPVITTQSFASPTIYISQGVSINVSIAPTVVSITSKSISTSTVTSTVTGTGSVAPTGTGTGSVAPTGTGTGSAAPTETSTITVTGTSSTGASLTTTTSLTALPSPGSPDQAAAINSGLPFSFLLPSGSLTNDGTGKLVPTTGQGTEFSIVDGIPITADGQYICVDTADIASSGSDLLLCSSAAAKAKRQASTTSPISLSLSDSNTFTFTYAAAGVGKVIAGAFTITTDFKLAPPSAAGNLEGQGYIEITVGAQSSLNSTYKTPANAAAIAAAANALLNAIAGSSSASASGSATATATNTSATGTNSVSGTTSGSGTVIATGTVSSSGTTTTGFGLPTTSTATTTLIPPMSAPLSAPAPT